MKFNDNHRKVFWVKCFHPKSIIKIITTKSKVIRSFIPPNCRRTRPILEFKDSRKEIINFPLNLVGRLIGAAKQNTEPEKRGEKLFYNKWIINRATKKQQEVLSGVLCFRRWWQCAWVRETAAYACSYVSIFPLGLVPLDAFTSSLFFFFFFLMVFVMSIYVFCCLLSWELGLLRLGWSTVLCSGFWVLTAEIGWSQQLLQSGDSIWFLGYLLVVCLVWISVARLRCCLCVLFLRVPELIPIGFASFWLAFHLFELGFQFSRQNCCWHSKSCNLASFLSFFLSFWNIFEKIVAFFFFPRSSFASFDKKTTASVSFMAYLSQFLNSMWIGFASFEL